ncbi:hypothetical protein B0H11DRAFT_431067 [Mycena galericulata]|nr:hypothetical protein B0H11DRAFT_431067 [Mycena galericulata]
MDPTLTKLETRGKVCVFGILASTSLASNQDRWMALDFSAFHDLFSEADEGLWLTAVPWQFPHWTPIFGDPHAQRLALPSSSAVTTVPVEDLKAKFLTSLAKTTAKANTNDTIIIVLCGHGEEGTGSLVIGKPGAYHEPLSKTQVELALDDINVPQNRVFLVSIACHTGWWRSPSWMLLAAFDRHQTHEPRRSTQDVDSWTDTLRRAMAGTYNEANSVFDPAPDTPSQLPIRPFTASFLDRLQVVESSVPAESGDSVVGAVRSSDANIAFRPLSTQDTALLQVLATEHNKVPHANVSIDVCVNEMARQVSNGVVLPKIDQRMLLECLLYRKRESRRAAAIAKQLGWESTMPVEQWTRGNGLDDMLRAESKGATIAFEFFFGSKVGARWWDPTTVSSNTYQRPYKTMGPGAWLADAWYRAGAPQVDSAVWENAVKIANLEVGYEH